MTGRERRNKDENWEKFEELMRGEIKKDEELMSEAKQDIFAMLRTNISHQRNMITHVAIVAGALASFSLLTLGSPWVYGKKLLVIAIIILLAIIGGSFFSLKIILDYENRTLNELFVRYSGFISKLIESRENLLIDKDTTKFLESLEKLRKEFSSEEIEEKFKKKFLLDWDKSKAILVYAFLFALFLIVLSFIKFSGY